MAEREMSADVAEAAEQTLAAEEGSAAPRGIKAKWRSLPGKKRRGIAVAVIVPLALFLLYALYNLAVLVAASPRREKRTRYGSLGSAITSPRSRRPTSRARRPCSTRVLFATSILTRRSTRA